MVKTAQCARVSMCTAHSSPLRGCAVLLGVRVSRTILICALRKGARVVHQFASQIGENYIMPIPPPIPAADAAGFSSFISATTDSVVRRVDAIDVAF